MKETPFIFKMLMIIVTMVVYFYHVIYAFRGNIHSAVS